MAPRLVFTLSLLLMLAMGGTHAQKLQGYVLPHSHDDVGWMWTPPQYFHGVVQALLSNSSRRFIVVEIAYFSMWWEQATPQQHSDFASLVKNGQIEFVLGGWVMPDETCTTYSTNIDQMTLGHQIIYDLFGVQPRVGWQIDPFGATNVIHEQFALMGFDATVVDRIPNAAKQARQATQELEFWWHPSASDPSLQIFTHCLDEYLYWTCVKAFGLPVSLPVEIYGVQKIAEEVVSHVKRKAAWVRTPLVLFPFGVDFAHFVASWDFAQFDAVMDYVNANSDAYGVELKYVTLSEYFDALHSQNVSSWPNYTGDFVPYNDEPHSYWTGFYSSRSALKAWVRSREAQQRSAETVAVLDAMSTVAGYNYTAALDSLTSIRQATAEAAHHDAVSGTSVLSVVQFYASHLQNGSLAVSPLIESSLASLTGAPELTLNETAVMPNVTGATITLYNSLAWPTTQWVRVGAYANNLAVTSCKDGSATPAQINERPASYAEPCETGFGCGFGTPAPYDLFFVASLPPLGSASYRVAPAAPSAALPAVTEHRSTAQASAASTFSISNAVLQLTFNNSTGSLVSVTHLPSQTTANLTAYFVQYVPATTNIFNVSEGPYVFHPSGPATPIAAAVPVSWTVSVGAYVSEVRQQFSLPCPGVTNPTASCGLTQTLRLYRSTVASDLDPVIEILHDAGPLQGNTDLAVRFVSTLQNNGIIYTDDNCWATHQRSFNASISDTIAGNVYPMPCWAFIQGGDAQLTLLADRTHGVSSLQQGVLEVMVHRRILTSDLKGPLALNDTDRLENVRSLLLFGPVESAAPLWHRLTYLLQYPPQPLFSVAAACPKDFAAPAALPPAVHLLTLSFLTPQTLLVRFAHVFEANEDANYSVPITFDVTTVLPFVSSLSERTLSGVAAINDRRRKWSAVRNAAIAAPVGNFSITLVPGQIRTFYASYGFAARLVV